jgi:hypothetical protein
MKILRFALFAVLCAFATSAYAQSNYSVGWEHHLYRESFGSHVGRDVPGPRNALPRRSK